MKNLPTLALAAFAFIFGGTAFAAPRTATLEVQNMSCVACAPIVKKTLSQLEGVQQVSVHERAGAANVTVLFNDEKVSPEALAKATTNAGFRARVKDVKNASTSAGTSVTVGSANLAR